MCNSIFVSNFMLSVVTILIVVTGDKTEHVFH